jgi:hypothetical protein
MRIPPPSWATPSTRTPNVSKDHYKLWTLPKGPRSPGPPLNPQRILKTRKGPGVREGGGVVAYCQWDWLDAATPLLKNKKFFFLPPVPAPGKTNLR